jgi:hypothetical protein
MAQVRAHISRYEAFRRDGLREDIGPELRVEALFLAAYQAIEAAAGTLHVHIGKHQNVRRELEANGFIFGRDTEEVWRAFQDLETRIRPKFIYGQAWRPEDLEAARRLFMAIESRTRERFAP